MKKNTFKALLLTIALANTILIQAIVKTTKQSALQSSVTNNSEEQKSAANPHDYHVQEALKFKKTVLNDREISKFNIFLLSIANAIIKQ